MYTAMTAKLQKRGAAFRRSATQENQRCHEPVPHHEYSSAYNGLYTDAANPEAKHLECLAQMKGWVCVKMASYITEDHRVKTTEQIR